jgi:hypothetical protein
MHNNLSNNTGNQPAHQGTDSHYSYANHSYSMQPELQLQTVDIRLDTKLDTKLDQTTHKKTGATSLSVPSVESIADLSHDWTSAFNTSLLTTRANHAKDRSLELGELMQTPEFASLLVGAQHLAATQGLSKEEATERLIEAFRRIDFAWKQIVIKRGLQALIE